MGMLISARGRAKLAFAFLFLLLAATALILSGQKTVKAWDRPDVNITAPADGATVSGVVTITASLNIEHGHFHEVQLLVDGDVIHETDHDHMGSGIYSHAWDSSEAGPGIHTITVRAYSADHHSEHFGEDSIVVNVQIPDTEAPVISIESPAQNSVTNQLPVNISADLSDNEAVDANTVVVKLDGTNITNSCSVQSTSVTCPVSPADGPHTATIDAKDTSGNAAAQKSVTFKTDTAGPALAVTSPADGATLIVPAANVTGTVTDAVSGVSSVMVNGEAAVLNGNSFIYGNLALSAGSNIVTVIATDNAGNTTQQIISITYVQPACSAAADCNDGDALTLDRCVDPGTAQAVCAHDPIACNTGADCNDDNALTLDACANPGQANSSCSHAAIVCNTNADCDDGDAQTIDTCANGGTVAASCAHAAVACRADSDCDDGDAHTQDICTGGGTAAAACGHNAIECLNNPECDDGNALTLDRCTAPGTAQAACAHDPLACNADTDCNDDNALTIDKCNNPGTAQSSCGHTAIACNTSSDCDDFDAHTLDSCTNAGRPDSGCAHTKIECIADADCDDGNASTTDICSAAGTKDSKCSNASTSSPASDEALTLMLTDPRNAELINRREVIVKGKTNHKARVTVNAVEATQEEGGVFSVRIGLNEGANRIIVVAKDSREQIEVTRDIVVDTKPPVIRRGYLEKGRIHIEAADNTGGSGIDATGFKVSVNGEESTGAYSAADKEFTLDYGEGRCVVTVQARDVAGNTSSMETISLGEEQDSALVSSEESAGAVQQANVPPDAMMFISSRNGTYEIFAETEGGNYLLGSGESYSGAPSYNAKTGTLVHAVKAGNGVRLSVSSLVASGGKIEKASTMTLPAVMENCIETAQSGDGNKVFYTVAKDSKTELYVYDKSGRTQSGMVASIEGQAVSPASSYDGSLIVFTDNSGGRYRIFLFNAMTQEKKELNAVADGAIETDPVFSPDYQWIYYVSNRDGQFDVYRTRISDGTIERVTDTRLREVRPSFDIHGAMFYAIRRSERYEIYKMASTTQEAVRSIVSDGNDITR